MPDTCDLAADLLGRTLARRHRAAAHPIAVQEIERVVRALAGRLLVTDSAGNDTSATSRSANIGAILPTHFRSKRASEHIPLEFNC